jgi:hypothetical protein
VIASTAVRALVFLYACEVFIMVRPGRAPLLVLIGVVSLVLLATLHGVLSGESFEITSDVRKHPVYQDL